MTAKVDEKNRVIIRKTNEEEAKRYYDTYKDKVVSESKWGPAMMPSIMLFLCLSVTFMMLFIPGIGLLLFVGGLIASKVIYTQEKTKYSDPKWLEKELKGLEFRSKDKWVACCPECNDYRFVSNPQAEIAEGRVYTCANCGFTSHAVIQE
jgi:hypothetical protein